MTLLLCLLLLPFVDSDYNPFAIDQLSILMPPASRALRHSEYFSKVSNSSVQSDISSHCALSRQLGFVTVGVWFHDEFLGQLEASLLFPLIVDLFFDNLLHHWLTDRPRPRPTSAPASLLQSDGKHRACTIGKRWRFAPRHSSGPFYSSCCSCRKQQKKVRWAASLQQPLFGDFKGLKPWRICSWTAEPRRWLLAPPTFPSGLHPL